MFNEDGDPLVPIEQVLEDMYKDSPVQTEARKYYYMHYATDEERKQMDKEDKVYRRIAYGIFGIGVIAILYAVGSTIGKLIMYIF